MITLIETAAMMISVEFVTETSKTYLAWLTCIDGLLGNYRSQFLGSVCVRSEWKNNSSYY